MSDAPVTGAFGGDPARKAEALARLDAAIASGRLVFDGRADPLALLVDGGDVDAFAEHHGYPVALAVLLAPTAAALDEQAAALFVRNFIGVVRPGADLRPVPVGLLLHILEEVLLFDGHFRDIAQDVIALHRATRERAEPGREAWAQARRRIVEADHDDLDPAERSILRVWEEAAWPVASGRSVVLSTYSAWCNVIRYADGWSGAREAETQAVLRSLWEATHDARARGERVHIPEQLHATRPDLAVGFEHNLVETNNRSRTRRRAFAAVVIAALAAA